MYLIYFILGAGFLAVFIFLFKVWQKISGAKKEPDQNFLVLNQRLDALANSTNQALRDTVGLISSQLKESRETMERSSLAVHHQVQNFTGGLTQLQEKVKNVHDSLQDVVSFQDIFKSPKLRGQWGETSLESVLAGYFPRELYAIQHYFKSGEAVDAVLKLPNNLLLPIDSKFNWENFEKMVNAEDEISKETFRKQFILDVKKKIDEISSKYILPSENTVDIALMYVPAESVYYEIIHHIKEPDIAEYARKKKIVLVSPNTFYVTLSAIHHWFRDVHITKQTQDIIRRLSRVRIDSEKLGDSFRKLGKHLSDASSAYGDSEKRLTLLTDRVERVVEVGEEEKKDTIEKEIGERVEV